MQESSKTVLPDCARDSILIIPRPIYNAMHPIERLMAQALERTGDVRITDDEE